MTLRYDFSGKVALITGGGSGIGQASANAFAAAGARVAIADISEARGIAAVAQIEERGGVAAFFPVNVSDPAGVQSMIDTVIAHFGRIDMAHNNAGIESDIVPMADLSIESWRRIIDTNLSSVFYCMKAEIAAMRTAGGGTIVNTASVLGLMGSYAHADYTASKHGVVGLTKAAALDHARDGVRVNAICPGLIDTPFFAAAPKALQDQLLHAIPMRRMGQPEEIARAVLWLCSADANYVTGHALAVDGGVVVGGTGTRID